MRRADDLRAHSHRQLKQSGDFNLRSCSPRDGVDVVVENFLLFLGNFRARVIGEVRFVVVAVRLSSGLEGVVHRRRVVVVVVVGIPPCR